ncbi:MAG: hypothetical protein AB7H77_03655 [Bdellovibrionales bacterium]
MKYLLPFILLIGGCAAPPVWQPGPEIAVPVAVRCRHAPLAKPVFPLQALASGAGAAALLQACLATDKLRQAYELRCEAALGACE